MCGSFIIAMRHILTSEFVQNNNNARSGFTLLKNKWDGFRSAKKCGRMILRLLKGRGMVLGLFEKKRDAIPPHPTPLQALVVAIGTLLSVLTVETTGLCMDSDITWQW
jgi:hypothetical protein